MDLKSILLNVVNRIIHDDTDKLVETTYKCMINKLTCVTTRKHNEKWSTKWHMQWYNGIKYTVKSDCMSECDKPVLKEKKT